MRFRSIRAVFRHSASLGWRIRVFIIRPTAGWTPKKVVPYYHFSKNRYTDREFRGGGPQASFRFRSAMSQWSSPSYINKWKKKESFIDKQIPLKNSNMLYYKVSVLFCGKRYADKQTTGPNCFKDVGTSRWLQFRWWKTISYGDFWRSVDIMDCKRAEGYRRSV